MERSPRHRRRKETCLHDSDQHLRSVHRWPGPVVHLLAARLVLDTLSSIDATTFWTFCLLATGVKFVGILASIGVLDANTLASAAPGRHMEERDGALED